MEWRWVLLAMLVAAAAGKGKKHRHHKPGRALLDRLASTTVGEVTVTSGAGGDTLPAPLDVAPYSTVAANATCGHAGAEEFCRDTPGKRVVVCDVCEGLDGSSSRRHPASHAVDGDAATWWQSPTLAAGPEHQHVELVATLPDKMELLHVIIKSGPSPRPLAWSLDVSPSEGGDDWRMVRAFGDREHCRRLWDLRPERRRRKARGVKRTHRADKMTCSTQFASPRPLENGEMHVGMGEGVTARRVRVSLRAPHDAPARQQYYSVRALTLAARCLCHGHARRCTVTSQSSKCSCLHGTCGTHCQRCCSGLPWAPHQPCDHSTEEKSDCSCGNRGACSYDDTGAIICVNCTDNRAGPLCDRCLLGYYNGVPDGPCLQCTCNPEGSDGTCTWDRGHRDIVCNCYPGYSGRLCDACEDPRTMFPDCQVPETTPACKCDPRGVVDPARVCDDVCECKANVVGERCDACAPGHFGLSEALPQGCRRCYCSHIADSCAARAEDHGDPLVGTVVLPLGEGWQVTDADNDETLDPSRDEQGRLYLISYEVEGWESFYWVTRQLSGDQLNAYGSEIHVSLFWGIVRGDTGGNPSVEPDVMLVAEDGTKLAYGNRSHDSPGQLDLVVPLVEGEWYRVPDGSPPVSRTELMDVLRDLRGVMIRAHFHGDQDEVRLESVSLRRDPTVAREQCSCGAGYGGAHCERCARAHARVPLAPRAAPRFECVPCACNGHADCATVNGPCGPCLHNTTGPRCERCLPGHYGNPVQGACKPCACPLYLPSNNFSPNCALASAEGDDFVCTQCPDGYTGDHCEHCDFGYWGSPTAPGSSCRACACGGSPCHRDTGLCLTCPEHTEGARCDQCEEGYWFGPDGAGASAGAACVACACGRGALSVACDARGGQCACRDGWTGLKCDACAEGHGDVEAGCPRCRCGVAALHNACDARTGACECAAGSAPPACAACLDAHYGLDVTGCAGCNCSSLGAEGNACDIRSGQCRCRTHVTGRACDTCEEGYWGLQLGGCRRCECGAGAAACDPTSGACACARGVGGSRCDTCLPSYYGFGPVGCLPCPPCSEGKVCSPDSGRCVCPARSRGPGCRQCAPGYWSRPNGCRQCSCGTGAVSNICDPHTGRCKCRSGWAGDECNKCASGHFGPRCRPCHCNSAGTRDCVNGTCSCDEMGRCPCKENVVGDTCEKCLDGTFGLSADNPVGCTACFCFGRSAHCTQAQVTRAALHAAAPTHLTLLSGDTVKSMDQDSLLAVHTHSPEATITLPWPPVPVYMELDKRFLGDRVTSYGGALRFTVEEEGGQELPVETRARFPLVRLFGRKIVLDYHERVPPINGTHMVRLHESLWAVRARTPPGARASRGALMLALQDVEAIMLRVTTRVPSYDDSVHALLLNVSLDTAIPGLSRSEPALGVELCECPRGYAAASCQLPALGFWLPPHEVRLTDVAGTIVISVEGEAQPCRCNGRAEACHPLTGDCLNCTEGTGGPRCEVCEGGYHGSPEAEEGCQACPCPSRARNFASACALSGHRLHCLCKPGYTGLECESCAPSYLRVADGSCAACACDPRGAASAQCDARGRCLCRQFAAGMKCDQCAARRMFLDNEGCKPCDNCTQTLLDSIEKLTSDLHSRADLTELSRIPKPFPALLEFAYNTTTLQNSFQQLKKDLKNSKNVEPLVKELEDSEHRLFTKANKLKTEAIQREEEAQSLSLESMSGLEEVLKHRRELGEKVAVLDEFARGERHLSAHRVLKEARHLLRHIKNMKLMDYIAGANDVSDAANLQSTAVQEYNYRIVDAYRRMRKLRTGIDQWETKAEDLRKLADIIWLAGDTVTAVEARVRPRLSAVRDTGLRCRLVLEDITNLSAHNLTEDTHTALTLARSLTLHLPPLAAALAPLAAAAEEKEGILYNLTPAYRKKYLDAVERHVQLLGAKARQYKSLFAGTRAVASAGVTAARAWREVADTVRNASVAATAAAAAAATAATLARGPAPMTHTAELTMTASEKLKRRGAAVLARADELRSQLEHLRRGADLVSVVLRGLGWQERELGPRPRADVAATLSAATGQADRVFATTRVLYDEASEVRRRVRYNLRRQLAELQKLGDTALGAAQEHVSQIRGNTARGADVAAALAAAAAARARDHAAAAGTLTPAMRALRDKIARARHAADSISVSVTSAPGASVGCARAYPLPSTSAAVTRVAVAVSFDNVVRDGPLVYILDDTQETENYMKLSVEKQKLQLSWDLGSGEAVIVHPEVLQAAHDDGDHTSYRIQIERVWNTVQLTVERAGGAAVTAVNSSDGGAVSLRSTQLWLGWPEQGAGLPGCVHALHSDDRTVGLWNFARQPAEAHCTGCTQRWYNSARGGESLVWFNGNGYAELRRSGLRPSDRRQFSLAFTFRTRDQDAVLFMAVDSANNRSVSVVMRECRVVFAVEYGGGARLEIAARGAHCRGRPAHVQAIRVLAGNKLERGSLRVNGEETLGSPTPPVQSAALLPDLSAAAYWVGGPPPGAAAGAAPAPPLLGCLGALTVDREGYDLLDTPTRHGVEPRCGSRTLRSAILEGAGYIELPSPVLRRKASLGLSFRARSDHGILLFRTPSSRQDNEVDDEDDGDDKHYLMLVIVEGELLVVAAAGKGEVRLRTNGTRFDDGALHTVRIIRAHKQLELWVDEERVAGGTLAGSAYPARSGGLYVGGAGAWDAARAPRLPAQGFTGTIVDIIVDASLIGLESAVRWDKAQLGRADSPLLTEPRAQPRELHAEPENIAGCTKTSSYTVEAGAVKFGDSAWSHATLKLAARAKELSVALQFRTFTPDGLLLLVPGPKSKPKHYLALVVREGKLKLIVRGRRRREVALAAIVADGTWRSVSIRVSRARLVLSSGGAAATAHAPPAARAPRLYVGGTPAPPTLPNIPNSIIRIGGFRGCIRRVTVNGRAEDLVRDAMMHHRVGQCFPSVEQGAYFAGDAYATWSSTWRQHAGDSEPAAEVRLQFRTAEPSGVLLATAQLVLELRDGAVVLTRLSSGRETSRTSSRGAGGRAVCDHVWHSVVAHVSRAALSLALDAGPELRGVPADTLLDDVTDAPLTDTPLYIGGLPEGVMDLSDGGKENFKGCIRDVTVGGVKRDWTKMEALHNVLLDSCPVAQ